MQQFSKATKKLSLEKYLTVFQTFLSFMNSIWLKSQFSVYFDILWRVIWSTNTL